ncbi:MAG: glycosyltransferase family 4 protein [Candidatus Omnitrophica bacterium]|nr:glycosyltransferase family 4 protein [Candidatus Omnitrophota bacterium]
MKVLLLTTHLDTGGIPVYVVSLARGLKRNGHQPVVLSNGGWMEKRLLEEGVPNIVVPCRTSSELNPKLWFKVFPRLLRAIREERPHLLHAHTRVTQVLGWAASLLTRVPLVTTCHGLYKYRIGRRIFRCWGGSVMAISEPSMQRLVEQYKLAPPHQVALIWNGVDVEHFTQAPAPEKVEWFRQTNGLRGDPIIGGIARLSPIKGLNYLLRAVPALLIDFPRLQVLLVGDGPERAGLVRLSYELGIADHVVISHPIEDTRIPMATMRAFVAPALEEGFGLSIVEAMAAGVPVIAADVGGPSRVIENGRSGFLVPPGDSPSVGLAIRSLLTDPALHGRIASAARERARREFDMRRVVQQVERVYERWAANGS